MLTLNYLMWQVFTAITVLWFCYKRFGLAPMAQRYRTAIRSPVSCRTGTVLTMEVLDQERDEVLAAL